MYKNIQPTEYSISTTTCTVYSNINHIDTHLINELYEKKEIFKGSPISINTRKRFKNCLIVKFKFNSDTDKKNRIVAINIFKTGNFHITGSKNKEEVESVLTYICDELFASGIIKNNEIEYKIEIRLINSNFSIPLYNIDLNKLYQEFKTDNPLIFVKYNPNNHPGVQIKINVNNVNVSCFVFGSAKVIITGSRTIEQLDIVYKFITNYIDTRFNNICMIKPTPIVKIPQKRGRKRLTR